MWRREKNNNFLLESCTTFSTNTKYIFFYFVCLIIYGFRLHIRDHCSGETFPGVNSSLCSAREAVKDPYLQSQWVFVTSSL